MANIRPYKGILPKLGERVYIDEAAVVIGDVELGADASVWPQTVIRGDVNHIRIGARSNVQDGCVIHVTRVKPNLPEGYPTIIEDEVTIGHGVVLHGCHIKSRVLVGNGAVVLDGATIEENVIVGAHALVAPNKTLKSGYLYMGSPCKPVRELGDNEYNEFVTSADNYVRLKDEYLAMLS